MTTRSLNRDYRWPTPGRRHYRWAEVGKWNIKRRELEKHFVSVEEYMHGQVPTVFGRIEAWNYYPR